MFFINKKRDLRAQRGCIDFFFWDSQDPKDDGSDLDALVLEVPISGP